jgi:hypothetical protein
MGTSGANAIGAVKRDHALTVLQIQRHQDRIEPTLAELRERLTQLSCQLEFEGVAVPLCEAIAKLVDVRLVGLDQQDFDGPMLQTDTPLRSRLRG